MKVAFFQIAYICTRVLHRLGRRTTHSCFAITKLQLWLSWNITATLYMYFADDRARPRYSTLCQVCAEIKKNNGLSLWEYPTLVAQLTWPRWLIQKISCCSEAKIQREKVGEMIGQHINGEVGYKIGSGWDPTLGFRLRTDENRERVLNIFRLNLLFPFSVKKIRICKIIKRDGN